MAPEYTCPIAECASTSFSLYCSGTFWIHKNADGTERIEIKHNDGVMSVLCNKCNHSGSIEKFRISS